MGIIKNKCVIKLPLLGDIIEVDGGRYDGYQIYYKEDTIVCCAPEGEDENTVPELGEWNYEDGVLRLADGRSAYTSPAQSHRLTCWGDGKGWNCHDMAREFIFENGMFHLADGRNVFMNVNGDVYAAHLDHEKNGERCRRKFRLRELD